MLSGGQNSITLKPTDILIPEKEGRNVNEKKIKMIILYIYIYNKTYHAYSLIQVDQFIIFNTSVKGTVFAWNNFSNTLIC